MKAIEARQLVNTATNKYIPEIRNNIDTLIDKRATQGYENLEYSISCKEYEDHKIKKIVNNLIDDGFLVKKSKIHDNSWTLKISWT